MLNTVKSLAGRGQTQPEKDGYQELGIDLGGNEIRKLIRYGLRSI